MTYDEVEPAVIFNMSFSQLDNLMTAEAKDIYLMKDDYLNHQNPSVYMCNMMDVKINNINKCSIQMEILYNNLNATLSNIQINRDSILENIKIRRQLAFNQIKNELNNTSLIESLSNIIAGYSIYI